MKRGVIVASQVFIYIMGAIVIILVILFGFRALTGIRDNAQSISLINFRESLSSSITKLAVEYGSAAQREFAVPAGYNRVCIIDTDEEPGDTTKLDSNIILNYWEGDTDENLFLIAPDGTVDAFFIGDDENREDRLEIADPHFICPEIVNGRITLFLQSLGDRVKLS